MLARRNGAASPLARIHYFMASLNFRAHIALGARISRQNHEGVWRPEPRVLDLNANDYYNGTGACLSEWVKLPHHIIRNGYFLAIASHGPRCWNDLSEACGGAPAAESQAQISSNQPACANRRGNLNHLGSGSYTANALPNKPPSHSHCILPALWPVEIRVDAIPPVTFSPGLISGDALNGTIGCYSGDQSIPYATTSRLPSAPNTHAQSAGASLP